MSLPSPLLLLLLLLLFVLLGYLDDDYTVGCADLNGRQADAIGCTHRFEHIVDQFSQCWTHAPHAAGFLAQHRVIVDDNRTNRHRVKTPLVPTLFWRWLLGRWGCRITELVVDSEPLK